MCIHSSCWGNILASHTVSFASEHQAFAEDSLQLTVPVADGASSGKYVVAGWFWRAHATAEEGTGWLGKMAQEVLLWDRGQGYAT